jgi:hypothetical protein
MAASYAEAQELCSMAREKDRLLAVYQNRCVFDLWCVSRTSKTVRGEGQQHQAAGQRQTANAHLLAVFLFCRVLQHTSCTLTAQALGRRLPDCVCPDQVRCAGVPGGV